MCALCNTNMEMYLKEEPLWHWELWVGHGVRGNVAQSCCCKGNDKHTQE